MTFQQIIKKVKSNTWWSEEAPSNFQQAIPAWRAFVYQGKVYGSKSLSICLALYKNDFLFEKTSEQEKLAQFKKVLAVYTRNPQWIYARYQKFRRAKNLVLKSGEELLASLKKDDKTLSKNYWRFYGRYTTFFTNSTMPEAADVYSDQKLSKDLAKFLPQEAVAEASVILATHPMLSFMEQERLEFLQTTAKAKPDFKSFARKYHWVQNNYLGSKTLDERYFQKAFLDLRKVKTAKEISEELVSLKTKPRRLEYKQKELLRRYPLPQKLKKTFELLRLIGKWIDERKYGALHGIYYIDMFLKEAAKRTTISPSLLGYCTPEEMVKLLSDEVKITKKQMEQRRKLSVYVFLRDSQKYQESVFTGKEAQIIFKLFEQRDHGLVSGHVASAPVQKFAGTVQVLLNPHTEKFLAGRILVTTMTRPDFVPLMRKASAIITDEGGITSHAAIVSRELGIPCIIGTKVSTKVFKTGNRVLIDTKEGTVKKLK